MPQMGFYINPHPWPMQGPGNIEEEEAEEWQSMETMLSYGIFGYSWAVAHTNYSTYSYIQGIKAVKNPNMTAGGHQKLHSSGALAVDGS